MNPLRRQIQRNLSVPRSRCAPKVDFVSIQRQISESVQFNRILRLKDRATLNASLVTKEDGSVVTKVANKVILTPALRLGFSTDQPAY